MDQAIGGRPAKQEVLDKRRSLQNPSGNLLDIHRPTVGHAVHRGNVCPPDRGGPGDFLPFRFAENPVDARPGRPWVVHAEAPFRRPAKETNYKQQAAHLAGVVTDPKEGGER